MKRIIQLVLLVVIVVLAFLLYKSIMTPINFEKEYTSRKAKVVDRLKTIRAIEEAYFATKGSYTNSFDSLENFYNKGKMETIRSVGSMDDSATVANTTAYEKLYNEQQKLIKARRPIRGEKLAALVDMSDAEIVKRKLAVRKPIFEDVKSVLKVDTVLLATKPGFDISQLRYVPGVVVNGQEKTPKPEFKLQAKIKETSSKIKVPLFQASVDNNVFLEGLDEQEIVNLNDEISKKLVNNYQGIKVGDIDNPNNNAGNWE